MKENENHFSELYKTIKKYCMKPFSKNILLLLTLLVSITGFSQLKVKPGNHNITYMGRIAVAEDSASMFWPGSSATIRFRGASVSVIMKSLRNRGYFYAIVDNDASKAFRFSTDSIKKSISIADSLTADEHTLMLYKLSNCTSEDRIYGFEIECNPLLLIPLKLPSRKIEFFGNSITAGHGVDRPEGMSDSGKPEHFNNYYTYAALTARHFNAQYSCIARSGIGIMLSWFPEIMPEVYNRLNPADSTSKWSFEKYCPDIVVINLFQNDSYLSIHPEHAQFKARFGNNKPTEEFIVKSYQDFVSTIRSKYPKAQIICALGSMDATSEGSKWPEYIQQAVTGLKDKKIHTIFFPFKKTSGHPTRNEQETMANKLIQFIEKEINWR
jgi:hypothetical protein